MGLPVCRVHRVLSQTNCGDGDLEEVGKSPASGISPCCRGLSARGSVSAGGPGQCRGRVPSLNYRGGKGRLYMPERVLGSSTYALPNSSFP